MNLVAVAICLALALVAQAGLSVVGPAAAHAFDPFLLVVVFFALRHGDSSGMLVGGVAGWLQDLHFAGPVLGLSALSKLVVGFCVGLVSSRLFLTGGGERALVVLGAALMDALLFERLVSFFDLPAQPISLGLMAGRAALTALFGLAIFTFADRRILARGRR